jgi:hypothetical protein
MTNKEWKQKWLEHMRESAEHLRQTFAYAMSIPNNDEEVDLTLDGENPPSQLPPPPQLQPPPPPPPPHL